MWHFSESLQSICYRLLENNLCSNLNSPAIDPREDGVRLAVATRIEEGIPEGSSHIREAAIVDVDRGRAAILAVQHVVRGGAGLDGDSFAGLEVFQQRKVRVVDTVAPL